MYIYIYIVKESGQNTTHHKSQKLTLQQKHWEIEHHSFLLIG